MKRPPRIAVWHADAENYARALRERLPGAILDAIAAADHETGSIDRDTAGAAAAISRAEVLLAWKVPAGVLSSMPALRWVQVSGAGVDHFLEAADLPSTVLLTRSLGRFGRQVAEYVVGYLLHHLLGIHTYRRQQRAHRWRRGKRPLLADCTVGIIGLGSLGQPTARALSRLGTRVLGARRSPGAVDGVDRVFTRENWLEMLPDCNALVLAAPKTAETRGMIDAQALAALPPGAVLINVARGDIVDEAALLAALETGHLGAAPSRPPAVEPAARLDYPTRRRAQRGRGHGRRVRRELPPLRRRPRADQRGRPRAGLLTLWREQARATP